MEPVKDSSHLYEVEQGARHAERPRFRISELQISPSRRVPWHYHSQGSGRRWSPQRSITIATTASGVPGDFSGWERPSPPS